MADSRWGDSTPRSGFRRSSVSASSPRDPFGIAYFAPPLPPTPVIKPANNYAQGYAESEPTRPLSELPAPFARHTSVSGYPPPRVVDYPGSISSGRSRRPSRNGAEDSVLSEFRLGGSRRSSSIEPSPNIYLPPPAVPPPNYEDIDYPYADWQRPDPSTNTKLLHHSGFVPSARSTASSGHRARSARAEDPRAAHHQRQRLPVFAAPSSARPGMALESPPTFADPFGGRSTPVSPFVDPFTPRTAPSTYLRSETSHSMRPRRNSPATNLPERIAAAGASPMSYGSQRAPSTMPYTHSRVVPEALPFVQDPRENSRSACAPSVSTASDNSLHSRLRRVAHHSSLASSYGQSDGSSSGEKVATVKVTMPGGSEVNVMEVSKGKKSKRRGAEVVRDWWK